MLAPAYFARALLFQLDFPTILFLLLSSPHCTTQFNSILVRWSMILGNCRTKVVFPFPFSLIYPCKCKFHYSPCIHFCTTDTEWQIQGDMTYEWTFINKKIDCCLQKQSFSCDSFFAGSIGNWNVSMQNFRLVRNTRIWREITCSVQNHASWVYIVLCFCFSLTNTLQNSKYCFLSLISSLMHYVMSTQKNRAAHIY